MNREEHLHGCLAPGRLADLTIWEKDPALLPGAALGSLNPTHTILGGAVVHGPVPGRPRAMLGE